MVHYLDMIFVKCCNGGQKMNTLEKIFRDIEEAAFQEDAPIYLGSMEVDRYVKEEVVKEIIRSHMDDAPDTNVGKWIPTSERLPNEEDFVKAYCRNHYCAEFIAMIECASRPLGGRVMCVKLSKLTSKS